MPPISFRRDNLSHGGSLKDDFDATVARAFFGPHSFTREGEPKKWSLAFFLDLKTDDGEPADSNGIHREIYSNGSLEFFWPSKDGETPVPLDKWDGNAATLDTVCGLYLVQAPGSDKTQLTDNTKFTGEFLEAMEKVGFADFDADASVFTGLYAHWNRLPMKERKGMKKSAEQKAREEKYGPSTVLVPTELKKTAKAGVGAKKTTTPAATTTTQVTNGAIAGGTSDIQARFTEAAIRALSAAPDNKLSVQELGKAVVKDKTAGWTGSEKSAALAMSADGEVLNAIDGAVYDESTETVSYFG